MGSWGGNLAGDRVLPDTATGGRGGISPGLAPGKFVKGRMGLEMCTASQAVGRNQGGQVGIAVKEANRSKGLRCHSASACVILWEGTQHLKSKLFCNIFQCKSILKKCESKKTHRGAGFGLRASSL